MQAQVSIQSARLWLLECQLVYLYSGLAELLLVLLWSDD